MKHKLPLTDAAPMNACRWRGRGAPALLLALWLASGGALANVASAAEPAAPQRAAGAKPAPDVEVLTLQIRGDLTLINVGVGGRRVVGINNPPARQFAEQLRPVLSTELAFARQICSDLTIHERKKIKAAGESALQSLALLEAERHRQPRAGKQADSGHPVDQLRAKLTAAIKEHAPPETGQRYAAEAARRIGNRRRATIALVVARLDGLLYLTDEQRQEIAISLADFWQTDWENWLQFSLPLPYLPAIPEGHVRCLTADQKTVWHSLQKTDFRVPVFQAFVQPLDDLWWMEPEPIVDRVFKILRERLE
jgi:hypothetical protein